MGYFNSSYFRWLYTGITRAKENLFTIDEPHFTIGSNLQPPKNENIAPRQDIFVLNPEISDLEISFDFSNEIPFITHLYLAITELLKDENVTISNIKHTNYLEHYTISQGNETTTFKIHYNGQNKVTSIEKLVNINGLFGNAFSKLIQLQNKTIVIEEQETEQSKLEFEFDKPFLKAFYENINGKLKSSNFHIGKIEHNQYHEIYEIHKNGFKATYKFWYNGESIFKKTEIIPSRTTGLTNEINELLKK